MSSMLLTFAILLMLGFISMFGIYVPIVRKYEQTLDFKTYMLPFLYLFMFYILGAIGGYFLYEHYDFIEPLNLYRVIVPIVLAGAIYFASFILSGAGFNVLVAICVGICVFMQPLGDGAPFAYIPHTMLRLIVVVFFTVYCLFYKILNCVPHCSVIPLISIQLGIIILSFLGAAPVYEALCCAMLVGAMLAFAGINFNQVKIDLDDGACCALAFIVSNLLMMNLGEFSFSSCIIFTLPFWGELIMATWNKFVVNRSGSLMENTNYFAAANKLSAQMLSSSVAKICFVCLFIGWFQLFSVNQASLILVALAITIWLNNTIGTPFAGKTNLQEINKEFVRDFKHNINEAKNLLINSSKKEDK